MPACHTKTEAQRLARIRIHKMRRGKPDNTGYIVRRLTRVRAQVCPSAQGRPIIHGRIHVHVHVCACVCVCVSVCCARRRSSTRYRRTHSVPASSFAPSCASPSAPSRRAFVWTRRVETKSGETLCSTHQSKAQPRWFNPPK